MSKDQVIGGVFGSFLTLMTAVFVYYLTQYDPKQEGLQASIIRMSAISLLSPEDIPESSIFEAIEKYSSEKKRPVAELSAKRVC